MQTDPQFIAKSARGNLLDAHKFAEGRAIDHHTALHFVITWLERSIASMKVVAAGHRIVLGGARFETPVMIDADVLAYLDSLVAMEPSHQPYNVLGARALAEAFPGLPQAACFDSSFHRTMPEVAQTLRPSQGCAGCGRTALGLPRHFIRLYQSAIAEIRASSAPRDRCASWGRRKSMRHAGRKEHGNNDGFRGA